MAGSITHNSENAVGANRSISRLLLVGVIFHIVYSISIFDVYFRSPIVHGMTPVMPPEPAPAKRLLLAVADGLRADKLFEDSMARAPFLRDIVQNRGSWGVSHTRVPTESRPGHVALIAGFYEDVSAVTKGWKMNPVNFDSVFNESRHTWSFGSPDILPMFSIGASDPNRVETFMYPPESEDFSEDASQLDTWVFEQFASLLDRAKQNSTLDTMLRQEKIVFFLHLLGLDTNGHAFRPNSPEYLNNINLVDAGMKIVEERLEAFYGDQATAYVFTADHGMSDRGNHGDGHPDNTRTPLIAWGAGVAGPASESEIDGFKDEWASIYNLPTASHDVNQADIAPLMSTLLSIPVPMNSVGTLPMRYLSSTIEHKAAALLANARQMLNQFDVKEDEKRETELWFKGFTPLANWRGRVSHIESKLQSRQWEDAIAECESLVKLGVEGMRYYQTYDWLFLRLIITLGYLGWMAYSITCILSPTPDTSQHPIIQLVTGCVVCGLAVVLYLQRSPLIYYAYAAFPLWFWNKVARKWKTITRMIGGGSGWQRLVSYGIAYIFGLEVLVLSYFHRILLCPALIFLGLVWPRTLSTRIRAKESELFTQWGILCCLGSVFPLFPVDGGENIWWLSATTALAFAALVRELRKGTALSRQMQYTVAASCCSCILVSLLFPSSILGKGLVRVVAWASLAYSLISPFVLTRRGRTSEDRLLNMSLCFAPVYASLTLNFEACFLAVFVGLILTWIEVERVIWNHQTSSSKNSTISTSPVHLPDLRIAFTFLLLLHLGFFGPSNIASLSSFSLASVYRFTTVFAPFLMAALLLFKILVPFLPLFLSINIIQEQRHGDLQGSQGLLGLIVGTADVMALTFFWLVKDEGSWLEIGSGISHFVICCWLGVWAGAVGGAVGGLVKGDRPHKQE
ncbi:Phosphatidylinositolglycan class N-domain-containing protein [Gaertneriomyces semiglobifer]|nr:Phosphatidylinositolglycan class N-domain-containing protein [Gaertneriomyces semiglobifer]